MEDEFYLIITAVDSVAAKIHLDLAVEEVVVIQKLISFWNRESQTY